MKYHRRPMSLIAPACVLALLVIIIPSAAPAYPTGITGRTLKTTTAGCSCHSASPSVGVVVTISGPDTVAANATATYTVTISGGPAIGSGVDIAARYGTLAPISTMLKLSNGELTHQSQVMMMNGSISFQFSLTLSGTAAADTLYATGLSSNNGTGNNGDQWNWAANKAITVQSTTTGVREHAAEAPRTMQLQQNYPNPFNPSTTIRYRLPAESRVSLRIYDVSGKLVELLEDGIKEAGVQSVAWNAGQFASGIYLCKLEATPVAEPHRTLSEVRKLILAK